MKQLPGTRAVGQRAMLPVLVAAAVGIALWGTAGSDSVDPGAITEAVPAGIADARAGDQVAAGMPIAFPRRVASTGTRRDLFDVTSWYVAPPAPPPVKLAPPPPPSAPPLPYTLMGSYAAAGGRTVYYLVKGDRMFDVHVGDKFDNVYRVDALKDDQLVLTYLPLEQQQTLSLRR
ncbi:MAG: hypothetical protein IT483_07270 [Gammaproteobacteria bacterium]|nr:hypothetical protein [Gammaproteobacteria bacterium]